VFNVVDRTPKHHKKDYRTGLIKVAVSAHVTLEEIAEKGLEALALLQY